MNFFDGRKSNPRVRTKPRIKGCGSTFHATNDQRVREGPQPSGGAVIRIKVSV
jgi:hypothetical protein